MPFPRRIFAKVLRYNMTGEVSTLMSSAYLPRNFLTWRCDGHHAWLPLTSMKASKRLKPEGASGPTMTDDGGANLILPYHSGCFINGYVRHQWRRTDSFSLDGRHFYLRRGCVAGWMNGERIFLYNPIHTGHVGGWVVLGYSLPHWKKLEKYRFDAIG